jgi:hypothetical protein
MCIVLRAPVSSALASSSAAVLSSDWKCPPSHYKKVSKYDWSPKLSWQQKGGTVVCILKRTSGPRGQDQNPLAQFWPPVEWPSKCVGGHFVLRHILTFSSRQTLIMFVSPDSLRPLNVKASSKFFLKLAGDLGWLTLEVTSSGHVMIACLQMSPDAIIFITAIDPRVEIFQFWIQLTLISPKGQLRLHSALVMLWLLVSKYLSKWTRSLTFTIIERINL